MVRQTSLFGSSIVSDYTFSRGMLLNYGELDIVLKIISMET